MLRRPRLLGLSAALAGLIAACGSDPASSKGGRSTTTAPAEPSLSAPAAPGAPSPAPAARHEHFDINHVLATGQSNAIAVDAAPPLTLAQPYANLKFDSGVIPARLCDRTGCKGYARPTGLVPLIEGDAFFGYGVETMSSGFANEASKLAHDRRLAEAHDLLVSLHGRSDHSVACLRKAGCGLEGEGYIRPFDEGMMQVGDAMALANAAGKSYVVRAVTSVHGESDHAPGDTQPSLIEWQHDYEAGVQAITGQRLPVPLFMLQTSNPSDVGAHVAAPGKVVVVGPGYAIDHATDCVHFTNHGQRRIGEYFAKAYARVVLEGKPWEPLRPQSVTVNGNVVTVKFLVPKPPLVLDTQGVKDPGHYGFEFADGTAAPPAITSVAIAGPDTVAITLTSAPAGPDKRLRYAFTASPESCPGARGNLRDADDTASTYGYDLYNWSVHFDEAVN